MGIHSIMCALVTTQSEHHDKCFSGQVVSAFIFACTQFYIAQAELLL